MGSPPMRPRYTGIDALEAAAHVLSTLYAWRKTLARRVSALTGIGSRSSQSGWSKAVSTRTSFPIG